MKPKKNNKSIKKSKITVNPKSTKHKISISNIFGWILIIFLCLMPLAPFILFLYNLYKK